MTNETFHTRLAEILAENGCRIPEMSQISYNKLEHLYDSFSRHNYNRGVLAVRESAKSELIVKYREGDSPYREAVNEIIRRGNHPDFSISRMVLALERLQRLEPIRINIECA